MSESDQNIDDSVKSPDFKDFEDDFGLLIECGFIGAKQLDEIGATRIFNACQILSKDSVAPQIGIGHIALSKLEIKKATDIFEQVIEKEPKNELALCFLGVCYMLSKDKLKKGEKIIADVLETSKDETVLNLAKLCLEWAKKDLSKTTSGLVK